MPTSGKKTTKLSDKDTYEEEEGEGGGLHQSPSPTCPVCLESSSSSSGMAVGACDHPVCAECCLRLRALCGRRECPVCRRDLPTVFVLSSPRPHAQVQRSLPPLPMDRRLGVCFESARLEARCRRLLLNRCGACGRDDFGSFALLEQHVRREHKLFFCDICTQDLKVFSHERRLYTRPELVRHWRRGDPDDPSSRGHPQCHFCLQRFPDRDAVYAHLRANHFSCHFCNEDGKQIFFDVYADLNKHFKTSHFLCVEGTCRDQKFTNAFRADIDYKAHLAREHSDVLGKWGARLNSRVDLGFGSPSPHSSPSARDQFNRRRGRDDNDDDPSGLQSVAAAGPGSPPDLTDSAFPSLDGSSPPLRTARAASQPEPTEDFPALSSPPSSRQGLSSAAYLSTRQADSRSKRFSAWDRRRMGAEAEFPGLSRFGPLSGFRRREETTTTAAATLEPWAEVAVGRTAKAKEETEKEEEKATPSMVTLTREREEFPGLPDPGIPEPEPDCLVQMGKDASPSTKRKKGKKAMSIHQFLLSANSY